MYENGIRVKGYHRKREHKRKLKKSHLLAWFWRRPRCASWEDFACHAKWPRDVEYWRRYYSSGERRFARFCSERTIRSKFRDMICRGDFEDLYAPSHADYRKEFDFWWTVF